VASEPGDVPTERPASLDRLDALLGSWEMEVFFEAGFFGPGSPAVADRGGSTTFEWLEGKFFLLQRFTVAEHPSAPSGIAIIGLGDDPEILEQHYYDSRGVARVYQMSLVGNVWKVWREAPGFWQRYEGRIADDATRIEGAWEKSVDGSEWEHDFVLNYVKVSGDSVP
jgi:hypothetical protein